MSLIVKNQSNREPAKNWARPSPLNTNLPVLKTMDYSLSIAEIYQENTPLSRTLGPILRESIFPSIYGLPEKHFGFNPMEVQNLPSPHESPSSSPHQPLDSPVPIVKLASQDATNLNASDNHQAISPQSPVSPLQRNITKKMNLPDYLEQSFEKWLDQVDSPQVKLHYTQLGEQNPPSSIETTHPKQETSSDSDSDSSSPDSIYDFRTENLYEWDQS